MNSTSDDLRLLSSVTTPFLQLSLFFFKSDHIKAAEARRKLSPRKPFYAYLYQDLKDLSEVLRTSSETSRVTPAGRKAIGDLLEHLERNSSRFPHQSASAGKRTYPNLHALLQIDDLNLTVLRRRIYLTRNTEQEFRRMVAAIKECTRELGSEGDQKRKYGHVIIQEPILHKPSDKKQKVFPAHRIRTYANSIHDVLLRSWECSCDARPCPYTTIRIQLAAHTSLCTHEEAQCDCKQAHFDLLFPEFTTETTLADESWRHGEIQVVNRRIVRFLDSENKQASSLKEPARWIPVEGVCGLIRTAAIRKRQLTLCFRDGKLWHSQSNLASDCSPQLYPSLQLSKSLAEFISGRQTPFSFRDVKRRERFALAVTLANALLYYYEGPWCLQSWASTQIYFYQGSERQNVPEFRRPYLSTTCANPDATVSVLKVNIWEHPYPMLQSFGCLLLAMELGRPVHMNNLREAFAEVEDENDGQLPKSFEHYFKAIEACLAVNTFNPGGSFQNEEFINQVWQNVVCPLETALYSSFPDIVGNLSARSKLSDVLSQRTLSSLKNKAQVHVEERVTNAPAPPLSNSTGVQFTVEPLPRQNNNANTTGAIDVCLHDDVNDIAAADPKEAYDADYWVKEMKKRVHPLLVQPSPEKVRVAILDTGIHLPEECDLIYEDQIMECRSWLGTTPPDGALFPGNADSDGHGTHATGLLLDLAPNAEIFVARVFEGRNEKQGKEMTEATQRRVAQAITYAVDTWKVHIITMSFGFEESVDIIDKAITHAHDCKVLMFAAASNCGGNSSISWPASSSLVVCIHAATGVGNRYRTTPTKRDYLNNFATLGSAVLSWWPEDLRRGQRVRKSGTSTAAPIAASIAAITMDVVRQPHRVKDLSERDLERLKRLGTADGMRAVFRRMVGDNGKRDGYDYIAPWEILDASPGRYRHHTTIVDNILHDLK